jgi:riboflavin transporter FmnP
MKTTDLALGVVFSALAIALNFVIRIPDPSAPFLYYQIWEIPILTAFFLFGVTVLFLVTCVNLVVLFIFFQGSSLLGPVYWLIAWISMMAGIGLVKILLDRRSVKNVAIVAALYTAFGVAFRTMIMILVNYSVLRFPPPVGFSIDEGAIVGFYVPVIAFFNATLALYTIPISYSLAKTLTRIVRTLR